MIYAKTMPKPSVPVGARGVKMSVPNQVVKRVRSSAAPKVWDTILYLTPALLWSKNSLKELLYRRQF